MAIVDVESIPRRAQAEQFDGVSIPSILEDAKNAIRWGSTVVQDIVGIVPRAEPLLQIPVDYVAGAPVRTRPDEYTWGSAKPGDWIVRYPGDLLEVVLEVSFAGRFRIVEDSHEAQ